MDRCLDLEIQLIFAIILMKSEVLVFIRIASNGCNNSSSFELGIENNLGLACVLMHLILEKDTCMDLPCRGAAKEETSIRAKISSSIKMYQFKIDKWTIWSPQVIRTTMNLGLMGLGRFH